MKKLSLFFVVFLFLAVGSATASAATRLDEISQLFTDYNQRFLNGKYVSDQHQIQSFNAEQDNLVAAFKSLGALRQILFIKNSYDPSLTVSLFSLTDENNNLLGFYYEKSTYVDEEERSYLRFSTIKMIETGIGFVPVNGSHALIVKGFYFKPSESATLQFNFMQNLKKNSWGHKNIFLLKKNNTWSLFSEQMSAISEAYVDVWTSLLPPNGGVKDILF
jgi:hypothetical protein